MDNEMKSFDVVIGNIDTLTDIAKKSIGYLQKDYPIKLDWINTQLRALNESIAEKSNLFENRTRNMTWLVQNQLTRQIKKINGEQEKEKEKLKLLEQQKKATDTRIKKLEIIIQEIANEKKKYLSEINYYGTSNSIKNLSQEEQQNRYSNALKNLEISQGKEEAARRKLDNAHKKLITLDSKIASCKKTIDQNAQTLTRLQDGMNNVEKTASFVADLEIKQLQMDIETKKRQLEELTKLKDVLSIDPDDLRLTLIDALEKNDKNLISECLYQFEQVVSPLFDRQSEIHTRYLDFKQNCNEKNYYNSTARAMDVFQLQRLELEQDMSKQNIDNFGSKKVKLEEDLTKLLEKYQEIDKFIFPYDEEQQDLLVSLSTAYADYDEEQINKLQKRNAELNKILLPKNQELQHLNDQISQIQREINSIDREMADYTRRKAEIETLKSKIYKDNYINDDAKKQDEQRLNEMETEVKEIDKTCDLLSSVYSSLQKYYNPQLENSSMPKVVSSNDVTFDDKTDTQNITLNNQESTTKDDITFEDTTDAPSNALDGDGEMSEDDITFEDTTDALSKLLDGDGEISEDDITFEDTPDAEENFETSIEVEDEEETIISERVTNIKNATVDLIKKAGEAVKNSQIAKFYKKRHEKKLHQTPKNYKQLKKQLKHYIKKHLNSFEDWEIGFLLEKISKENGTNVKEQFDKFEQVDVSVNNYIKLLKKKPADHIVIKVKSTDDGEILKEPGFKINPFASGDKLISIDKKLFDELMLAKAQENQDSRRNNYGK